MREWEKKRKRESKRIFCQSIFQHFLFIVVITPVFSVWTGVRDGGDCFIILTALSHSPFTLTHSEPETLHILFIFFSKHRNAFFLLFLSFFLLFFHMWTQSPIFLKYIGYHSGCNASVSASPCNVFMEYGSPVRSMRDTQEVGGRTSLGGKQQLGFPRQHGSTAAFTPDARCVYRPPAQSPEMGHGAQCVAHLCNRQDFLSLSVWWFKGSHPKVAVFWRTLRWKYNGTWLSFVFFLSFFSPKAR